MLFTAFSDGCAIDQNIALTMVRKGANGNGIGDVELKVSQGGTQSFSFNAGNRHIGTRRSKGIGN